MKTRENTQNPQSSRGTSTLYKRLGVSNHFHTLFLISNENLTPTPYAFSEFLSANFRENSEKWVFFSRKNLISGTRWARVSGCRLFVRLWDSRSVRSMLRFSLYTGEEREPARATLARNVETFRRVVSSVEQGSSHSPTEPGELQPARRPG